MSPAKNTEAHTVETLINRGYMLVEDGTILITHLNMKAEIISGTFGNNKRLTKGRPDIYFITFDKRINSYLSVFPLRSSLGIVVSLPSLTAI